MFRELREGLVEFGSLAVRAFFGFVGFGVSIWAFGLIRDFGVLNSVLPYLLRIDFDADVMILF